MNGVCAVFRAVLYDPSDELYEWLADWEGWQNLEDIIYIGRKNEEEVKKALIERECEVVLAASERNGILGLHFIKKLLANNVGIFVIVIGARGDYETVRSVFLSGALDYLTYDNLKNNLFETLVRISGSKYNEYFNEKIYEKVVLIARYIFDGGSNVNMLVQDMVNRIYDDWNCDNVAAHQVIDKVKEESYKYFVAHKPWLGKFVYGGDYIRDIGYEIKSREETERELCRYYSEVSELFKKYNIIDVNKTVYVIGKCVIRNVDTKITLESVAKEIFLNKTYVSHIFKKMTGVSFNDFVTEVKIDRAKVLLRYSDVSVSMVAEILNFSNPGYFSAKFKERVGISPMEYRMSVSLSRYSDHT